ncbi:MAG: DinB family protein [Anaerolineae bacterium]
MDKAEFLHTLRSTRAEWDALIAQVPRDQMTQPDAVGQWSIKDLIAHVMWYENEMVEVIESHVFEGSPWWELEDVDERNERIYEQYRDVPLDKVLADAQATYLRLLAGLESLSEEDFHTPQNFRNMPPEWIPWQVIASNCFEHYPQHSEDLEAWLARQK